MLSKKIKVFLFLFLLFSIVISVGIFFGFDFKKLGLISSENKETVIPNISNITPTPIEEIFTDFIYLPEGTFDCLPIEKSSFETGFETMKENYQSEVHYTINFELKENEEIKAIFDGEIISVLKKKAAGEQPNDYLEILLENEDRKLMAIYLVAGEVLIKENQYVKTGDILARIGKGVVPPMAYDNFSLTVFMGDEENIYKPIALEAKIFKEE